MARIVLIGVALIAFCLLPALQASAQQPAEQAPMVPAKDSPSYQLALKQAEANAQLDSLAKGLAGLLSEPGFRGHVRSTIAQSKNSENIVELEDFLAKAVQKTDLPPGVKKLNDTVLKAKTRTRDLKVWNKEGFDLYFPVKDHLNKWKGDTDFYVAYTPYNNSRDVGEIYGYSVKTGERYAFSVAAAPDVPVLIVAPCEHETHEVTEGPGPLKTPPPGASTTIKPDNEPRKVQNDKKGNSKLNFSGIRIDGVRDYVEPWAYGNMEVYMQYGDVNTQTSTQHSVLSYPTKFVSPTGPKIGTGESSSPVYLSNVKDMGSWYPINFNHEISNTCTDASIVWFYERDGGAMAASEGGGTTLLYQTAAIYWTNSGGLTMPTALWYSYYSNDCLLGSRDFFKSRYPYSADFTEHAKAYSDVSFMFRKYP